MSEIIPSLEKLPPKLQEYLLSNFRSINSKTFRRLIDILNRIMQGEEFHVSDFSNSSVYYYIRKLREDGVLWVVKPTPDKTLIIINPEYTAVGVVNE